MIQSMMLRQRKGCNDPKDLEGVLPVLDCCLYDGGTLLFALVLTIGP